MRRLTFPIVPAPVLVAGCAGNPDRQTLVELRNVRPDVQEVQVDQGLDKAMEGRGILAGMNAALIWNLFQRPFTRGLPQRPPEKEPEFSSAKGLELLQRGTPEAAMASYRFRLMQNSIPKKQLDQAVIAYKHLNNVERNTRKQAEIEVFEVGIL